MTTTSVLSNGSSSRSDDGENNQHKMNSPMSLSSPAAVVDEASGGYHRHRRRRSSSFGTTTEEDDEEEDSAKNKGVTTTDEADNDDTGEDDEHQRQSSSISVLQFVNSYFPATQETLPTTELSRYSSLGATSSSTFNSQPSSSTTSASTSTMTSSGGPSSSDPRSIAYTNTSTLTVGGRMSATTGLSTDVTLRASNQNSSIRDDPLQLGGQSVAGSLDAASSALSSLDHDRDDGATSPSGYLTGVRGLTTTRTTDRPWQQQQSGGVGGSIWSALGGSSSRNISLTSVTGSRRSSKVGQQSSSLGSSLDDSASTASCSTATSAVSRYGFFGGGGGGGASNSSVMRGSSSSLSFSFRGLSNSKLAGVMSYNGGLDISEASSNSTRFLHNMFRLEDEKVAEGYANVEDRVWKESIAEARRTHQTRQFTSFEVDAPRQQIVMRRDAVGRAGERDRVVDLTTISSSRRRKLRKRREEHYSQDANDNSVRPAMGKSSADRASDDHSDNNNSDDEDDDDDGSLGIPGVSRHLLHQSSNSMLLQSPSGQPSAAVVDEEDLSLGSAMENEEEQQQRQGSSSKRNCHNRKHHSSKSSKMQLSLDEDSLLLDDSAGEPVEEEPELDAEEIHQDVDHAEAVLNTFQDIMDAPPRRRKSEINVNDDSIPSLYSASKDTGEVESSHDSEEEVSSGGEAMEVFVCGLLRGFEETPKEKRPVVQFFSWSEKTNVDRDEKSQWDQQQHQEEAKEIEQSNSSAHLVVKPKSNPMDQQELSSSSMKSPSSMRVGLRGNNESCTTWPDEVQMDVVEKESQDRELQHHRTLQQLSVAQQGDEIVETVVAAAEAERQTAARASQLLKMQCENSKNELHYNHSRDADLQAEIEKRYDRSQKDSKKRRSKQVKTARRGTDSTEDVDTSQRSRSRRKKKTSRRHSFDTHLFTKDSYRKTRKSSRRLSTGGIDMDVSKLKKATRDSKKKSKKRRSVDSPKLNGSRRDQMHRAESKRKNACERPEVSPLGSPKSQDEDHRVQKEKIVQPRVEQHPHTTASQLDGNPIKSEVAATMTTAKPSLSIDARAELKRPAVGAPRLHHNKPNGGATVPTQFADRRGTPPRKDSLTSSSSHRRQADVLASSSSHHRRSTIGRTRSSHRRRSSSDPLRGSSHSRRNKPRLSPQIAPREEDDDDSILNNTAAPVFRKAPSRKNSFCNRTPATSDETMESSALIKSASRRSSRRSRHRQRGSI